MVFFVEFAHRIQYFRKLSKLTVEDVAKELNISVGLYRKYETGYHSIPHQDISKLCDLFGITPNILYGYIPTEYAKLFAYVLDTWDGDTKALINMLAMYAIQPIETRRDVCGLCIFSAEQSIKDGTCDMELAKLIDFEYVKEAHKKLYKKG